MFRGTFTASNFSPRGVVDDKLGSLGWCRTFGLRETEMAMLGHMTGACGSRIIDLCNVASNIQKANFLLPRTPRGHDQIQLRSTQPVAATPD